MKSFKITKNQIEKLLKKYNDFKIKDTGNYKFYIKKDQDLTISIYKTKTIFFQGKNKKKIKKFIKDNNLINENKLLLISNEKKEIKINVKKDILHIGCDESGVGDYFGPIVLTIFNYTLNLKKNKIFNSIRDSKELNKSKILEIAKELLKLKDNYKYYIITNKELNEKIENNWNSKELLTFHYVNLLNNFKSKQKNIIIDGFIKQKTFKKYCLNRNLEVPKIKLIIKAENIYKGVAAASIISRFLFLKEIKKLEKTINFKIKLGANNEVKKQVKEFKKKFCQKEINKIIKTYFNI